MHSLKWYAYLNSLQICNPALIERAFSAYCAVADAAIYQKDAEYVTALLPVLARISNELLRYGLDDITVKLILQITLRLE